MTFGVTVQDILEAYPGTIEADFAAGGKCGSIVIGKEIELQYGRLLASLPAYLRGLLRRLRGIVVSVGPDGRFEPPIEPESPAKIEVFNIAGLGYSRCDIGLCEEPRWSALPTLEYDTFIDPEDDETRIYQLVGNPPFPGQIALSYKISPDAEILSLKEVLRSMVACSLGRRLYATLEEQEWNLVTHYCNTSQAFLESIGKRWLPLELADLDMLWRPSLITSYTLQRVN